MERLSREITSESQEKYGRFRKAKHIIVEEYIKGAKSNGEGEIDALRFLVADFNQYNDRRTDKFRANHAEAIAQAVCGDWEPVVKFISENAEEFIGPYAINKRDQVEGLKNLAASIQPK